MRISLAPALLPLLHAPPPRVSHPRAALLPLDDVGGVSLDRQLGALNFAEVETVGRDAEAVLSGVAATSVGAQQATVGLYYGQLMAMNARGTRVLVKRYGAKANNELQRSESAASAGDALLRSLEASFAGRGGMSVAEALAENEYAAHSRVQALCGCNDVEQAGLLRMLGRHVPRDDRDDDPAILHAFPWRGEQVRMALPTALPPTLASWMEARQRGTTPGARFDASVPLKGLQDRGRFLRATLRGALTGLATLHRVGLLHQSVGPAAVLLSSEDDRKGNNGKGWLCELGFCRDAPSLELVYRAAADGTSVLPAYEGTVDVLDAGLLDRACRKCTRPGDPEERGRFGRADDVREFGMLLLSAALLPNAAPDSAMDMLGLRNLCDGPFAACEDGMQTDGVDVARLRDYLDAEDELRLGGVGGVDVLAVGGEGRDGWDLLERMLAARWEERPSAEEALAHPWWEARMFF